MRAEGEVRLDRNAPGVAVFELVGDHDMARAPELETALIDAVEADCGIVVDLSESTFIDSSVIHGLLKVNKQLAARGRELVLQIRTASIVVRVLEITDLYALVPVTKEREEAVALALQRREDA